MIYISDITSRNTLDNTPINKNKRAAAVCTREDNAHIPPLLMTGYSTYIYKVLQVQPSTMQQMELGHVTVLLFHSRINCKECLQSLIGMLESTKINTPKGPKGELNCMKS